MPDYEPLPTAPTSLWVGPADAELYFDQLGISWAGGVLGFLNPRVVNIADLCSAPPPATSEITTSDIVGSMILGPIHDAAMAKLNSWVDRAVWDNNCIAVDAPTPDPQPPQAPPADLPPGPIPLPGTDRMIRDIHTWTEFTARNIVPRNYHVGTGQTVSGTGYVTFTQDSTGSWPVWPAGILLGVDEKPEYAGRSNGGDFPVYYDLGWLSLANGDRAQPPFRLQHEFMMVYGSLARVNRVYYNLPPGVTIGLAPLYPDTAEVVAE